MSADTDCWYWRCDECGHVWTVSRTDETDIRYIFLLSEDNKADGTSN